jgi:hypothetical protein
MPLPPEPTFFTALAAITPAGRSPILRARKISALTPTSGFYIEGTTKLHFHGYTRYILTIANITFS